VPITVKHHIKTFMPGTQLALYPGAGDCAGPCADVSIKAPPSMKFNQVREVLAIR